MAKGQKSATAKSSKRPANAYLQGILNTAHQFHERGNDNQAQVLYHQVLQDEPGNPFALYGLGSIALRAGDAKGALGKLEKAVERGFRSVESLAELGLAEQMCGHLEEAMEHYRATLAKEPNQPAVLSNLSGLLAQRGDFESALEHARKAIKFQPEMAPAHANAGVALMGLGRKAEAAKCLEEVLRLDANHPGARQALQELQGV